MPLHDTKKDGPTMFTRDNQVTDADGQTVHRWSSYEITEKVMQSIMNDAVVFAA